MKSTFRRVALFGKYQPSAFGGSSSTPAPAMREIAQFLVSQGCDLVLDRQTQANAGLHEFEAQDIEAIGEQCDLALVVGGDGTMLGIGRQLAPYGVPLIGINQGRLGFITDIPLEGYQTTLAPMLAGAYEEDHRSLMHARVMRGGQCVFDARAMNDVVINRGPTSGMVELRIEIDGHFVSNQRCDGMIVATPTGSTAYALSAGGPLMHPSIPGWVLVPIAPHSLSNRPLVLADPAEVAIELVSERDASANFDMQSLASLQQGDRITVRRSQHCVRFLHPKGWHYFDTLRAKLHWNGGG
ncbi:NAD kinase [Pseudorhodoferax sp. Leaf274]|uniref:NAD kinase n=1 Tax=Pseudorhodoferax sp. Leaf274 TaxID=1736318 RepID=UPI0007036F61|nr:NAD kinase [Pseudorhodoferax sp. Leaf274]KQP43521.1 NAD kinase [Pseudorhodoferax sp. Leaf274]